MMLLLSNVWNDINELEEFMLLQSLVSRKVGW